MSEEKVGSLTQDELLAELHRRGYDDVTERQIAEWRRRELLPPFDVQGGGEAAAAVERAARGPTAVPSWTRR